MIDYSKKIGKVYRDVNGDVQNLTVNNQGLIEIVLAKINELWLAKKLDISEKESGQWMEVVYTNEDKVKLVLNRITDDGLNQRTHTYDIIAKHNNDIQSVKKEVTCIVLSDLFLVREDVLDAWLLLYQEATQSIVVELKKTHQAQMDNLT